ncbi:MAG TPA: helix-turn-helix domain-containing protein [Blastocatellia bacterium]|nr:helix-turn-helix domain-containing protein [Blastocatellia bacterium]
MLTTNEAAEILGVKPVSVRVWLNEEGHPRFPNAQKFGRDWQIPESDLAGLPRGRKRGRPSKAESSNKQASTIADDVDAVQVDSSAKPKKRAGKKPKK